MTKPLENCLRHNYDAVSHLLEVVLWIVNNAYYHARALYSVVQKNSSMFEFAAFLLPTNVGQPMHSPSALTEHVSLNLAWFFLLNAVVICWSNGTETGKWKWSGWTHAKSLKPRSRSPYLLSEQEPSLDHFLPNALTPPSEVIAARAHL